ncbi:MAG: hypothetical protein ACK5QK_08780 [Chryseotalea sp.]
MKRGNANERKIKWFLFRDSILRRAYILQQYVLVIAGCGVVFKFILLFSFYARGKDVASKARYDQYTRVGGKR